MDVAQVRDGIERSAQESPDRAGDEREGPRDVRTLADELCGLLDVLGAKEPFLLAGHSMGAMLALLGRVRLLDWIPRRAECGTPCQTCRHRCGYHAIGAGGTIAYEECFQCMECVVIHASDEQCAPRILERRRGRSIPIVPASVIIDRRA